MSSTMSRKENGVFLLVCILGHLSKRDVQGHIILSYARQRMEWLCSDRDDPHVARVCREPHKGRRLEDESLLQRLYPQIFRPFVDAFVVDSMKGIFCALAALCRAGSRPNQDVLVCPLDLHRGELMTLSQNSRVILQCVCQRFRKSSMRKRPEITVKLCCRERAFTSRTALHPSLSLRLSIGKVILLCHHIGTQPHCQRRRRKRGATHWTLYPTPCLFGVLSRIGSTTCRQSAPGAQVEPYPGSPPLAPPAPL